MQNKKKAPKLELMYDGEWPSETVEPEYDEDDENNMY